MPKAANPFAGIKLSGEAVTFPPPLDQRLFTPGPSVPESEPSPVPTIAPTPQQPVSQERGKEGRREGEQEAKRQAGQEPTQEARKESGRVFDLNDEPLRKNSFLFTEAEYEALEDLKLDLRRQHGMNHATKNDIIRAALHHLLEDYRRDDEASIVVRRLKSKVR